jgi:hypothetical protein
MFNPDPDVKVSLNYPCGSYSNIRRYSISWYLSFVQCLSMFGFRYGISDSFVVSKKCVCVNYDLLGHFSHFMFSAGGVVHTWTCCVTLHSRAELNNFWDCNKKIL